MSLNLDQQAALYAQQMVKEGSPVKDAKALENLITKTLGVLQEQGVYACMLFLFSRSSDEAKIAPYLRREHYQLLGRLPQFEGNRTLPSAAETIATLQIVDKKEREQKFKDASVKEARTALEFYSQHVLGDLDTLLLVKELYEQTLIYARYGAKAEGKV
jgi:hypothetical protein